jgi:4-amino-4-deoxyprephenate dehydrogenase
MARPAPDRCVIAGANGRFGRIWARKLAEAGAEICGLDLQDAALDPAICRHYVRSSVTDMVAAAEHAIAEAEYVLLCVPENAVLQALPRLGEIMRDDALLMDIASVKTRIRDALAGLSLRCGYLSLHPMFGPMEDFSDRAICLIPLRENARAAQFASLIAGWGARLSTLTAEQHDSVTALVQTLPHAALIAFGAALSDSGASFELVWDIATPIQKIMLALAARIVAGEPEIYWSIQSANPFAASARDKLEDELRQVSALVEEARRPEFAAKLESVQRFLSPSGSTLAEMAARLVSMAK